MEDRPLIAITMGDPAGVGPEIIIKTFQDHSVYDFSCPFVVGDANFLRKISLLLAPELSVNAVSSPQEASFTPGLIDVLDLNNISDNIILGQSGPISGKPLLNISKPPSV